MFLPRVIRIEFPALDRLLSWLEAHDQSQSEIDALTKRVEDLNAKEKAALGAAQQ